MDRWTMGSGKPYWDPVLGTQMPSVAAIASPTVTAYREFEKNVRVGELMAFLEQQPEDAHVTVDVYMNGSVKMLTVTASNPHWRKRRRFRDWIRELITA